MARTVPDSTRPGLERQVGSGDFSVEPSVVDEGVKVSRGAEVDSCSVDVEIIELDGEQAVMNGSKASNVRSSLFDFVA